MHRIEKAAYALFIIMLCLWPARTTVAGDYYGQPGEFLRYSPSARALAMGRAYTALGQDANIIHWNPGALGPLQRTGLSLVGTQASMFGQANYSSLSFALPLEIFQSPFFRRLQNLTLGMSFLNLTSDITAANEFGQLLPGNTLNSSQGAFSLGAAATNNIRYLSDFSVGVGMDFIWNNLFGYSKKAVGFNIGLYYRNESVDILNWFAFGLAFKNINRPNIALEAGVDESIPTGGRLGVAFLPPFCSSLPDFVRPLIFSLDYDLIVAGGSKRGLYLGVEYNISRLYGYVPLRLRMGTNTRESSFTFGLSLDLPSSSFIKKGVQYLPVLDYSFNFYSQDYLGDVKQGAISFAWTPKTPADWYAEGMKHFPTDILSLQNQKKDLEIARRKLGRVFDSPQLLANPNYAALGYDALLRIGDIELAGNWLENNRSELLSGAFENYGKTDDCISYDHVQINAANSKSLLYRLQAEIDSGRPTEEVFNQPYVNMINNRESVEFLRGYSYYVDGEVEQAISSWRQSNLPIAQFYLAKATRDTLALKKIAFSQNTKVSRNILLPLISDFNIADNALYEYAQLTESEQWMTAVLRMFPLSDLRDIITKRIRKED